VSGRHLNALVCHPAASATGIASLAVSVDYQANGLALSFHLTGEPQRIRLPRPAAATQADGLWQHTCCEAFIATNASPDYLEFNFSPSGQWAIYRFSDYRCRDEHFQAPCAPQITFLPLADGFRLDAIIPVELLPTATELHLGLTAVIEDSERNKSYWALTHCGQVPDFHLRPSFTLKLATP
jgi:hypothetical protein